MTTTEAETGLSDNQRQQLLKQITRWREDLLNLDRRQKLVYFSHARTASLEIIDSELDDVLDRLDNGTRLDAAESESSDEEVDDHISLPLASGGLVVKDKTPSKLRAACRRLDQVSNQVYADRGFWTLYAGIGMLLWIDPDTGSPVHSPLLLCPVKLQRSGSQAPYTVVRTEDEIVVNPALRLKLEKDFGIHLSELDPDWFDVFEVIDDVRTKIAAKDGWSVHHRVVLTTFSFHKEAIYRDLMDHQDVLLAHPMVQMVALGDSAPSAGDYSFEVIEDDELDRVVEPEKLMSILDADSTQRRCIIAARDGRSFVVDGPPGTGKSQTIANIICELIATDKTVLFVSEKAAALDVVRNRLTNVGLGDFLLELHSHAATRKEVVSQLGRALTQRAKVKGQMPEADRQSLRSVRERLTDFASAMSEERDLLHQSVYEALGRLMEVREDQVGSLTRSEDWAGLTAVQLDHLLERAGRLARAWRPVSQRDNFLWRELVVDAPTPAQTESTRRAADGASAAARALSDRMRAVDESLALSMPPTVTAATDRVELLELLGANPSAPSSWLHLADLASLRDRIGERQRVSGEYKLAKDALTAIVGAAWQDVDPDSLASARSLLDRQLAPLDAWWPDASTTVEQLREVRRLQSATPEILETIANDARQLSALLGVRADDVSFQRAMELAELAALGGRPARPEREWLNPAVQAALDESSRVLAELVELVNQRRAAIEKVFRPSALELDLAGLNVRFSGVHTGLRKFSKAARADRKLLRSVVVTGKVDKGVLARLDEAVDWQQAELRLAQSEETYASRLGSYYRRTETDFNRLADAIATAHRAVQLAAGDLNNDAMARQLTADGTPDPQLLIVAERLMRAGNDWIQEVRGCRGDIAAAQLGQLPLHVIAEAAVAAVNGTAVGYAAAAQVTRTAGRNLSLRQVVAALERASIVADRDAMLLDTFEQDRIDIGALYDGAATDWAELAGALDWADRVRDLAGGAVSQLSADRMSSPTIEAAELAEPIERWAEASPALTSLFSNGYGKELQRELEEDLAAAADLLSEMTRSALTDIGEWTAYTTEVRALEDAGLGEIVGALHVRRASASTIVTSIEYAVLQAWVESVMSSDARLAEFRSTDRDALVRRFKDLDQQLVRSTHVAVAEACNRRRPKTIGGTAAGVIQREAQKKTRHLPIRELLSKAEDLVQELKPCFMMSPLSVSQFLPGSFSFDVVIFDEASQVLPSDAVNCIYRARQLIVAGDEKQLPPTAFFTQAIDESEDDEGLDDFESVLKLCKTSFASLPLSWHYRSQHENLIAYSNYRFYSTDGSDLRQGALQTFPGARFEAPDLGVESFVVNGVYRRGSSRDNPIEAEAVVDRILHHRRLHPELSIGVVTFSSAQEETITAAIDRRSADEPLLQGLLDSHDRLTGFFVKNLENVQGDERDIIIFSIGYGPDENGKFTMSFGPLNTNGGWRRLNVAITRARMRVEVVSSFRAGEMHETSSEGVRHLRGYLDFAQRGLPALALELAPDELDVESAFEADVQKVIQSWGYDVVPQVGTAGYRIDLGVRHPDRPGEYLLGVESDGAAYHSAKAARDRDRLRAAVLEGLGWQLHRIWGLSWYRDRDGQIARLRRAINEALAGVQRDEVLSVAAQPVEMEEIDLDQAPEWTVTYDAYSEAAPYTYYELSSVESREPLRTYLIGLLRHEAPIHRDLVNKRIRAAFNVGRIGSAIRDNIDFVARRSHVDGNRISLDAHGFYRLEQLSAVTVRVPGNEDDIRPVQHVPADELDLAVVGTVADAVSVDEAEVINAVRRMFGWRRSGADIVAAVQASIARCVEHGTIEHTPSGSLRIASA
ncbi:DUF3320 domain-containing protein [Kribbella pittospori]|uniref:DUF3320 domain-containing protein n=1 Tax=Kribbella pittospori TaxID=722689 RepID=A0A4R0KA85_9ACTN|nr:DUF3320 domain-containing protein [Kribbella pittospori]TCC55116.1 DUF3320 domain-containing protein [Kribbella pittospori]